MASRKPRARATRRSSLGGTLLGFMAGLVVGLAIAVVVAIFVTRAPVPFLNKAKRSADRLEAPPSAAQTPDPNAPLYNRPADSPASPVVPDAPASSTIQPAPQASAASSSYILQAGAFRGEDDADGMRAKLALIGYEARVVEAQVDGRPMFRVRIGPYADMDTLNDARARLAQSGIEASVIRAP